PARLDGAPFDARSPPGASYLVQKTNRSAPDIETVLRQSFADDVTVGHHADQPVVLSNGNGAYVMLTHQFCDLRHGLPWTDPVSALVHCVFYFHGRPPLLKFAHQRRLPSRFDYTTDRFLWHGPQRRHTQEFSSPRSGTIAGPRGIYPTAFARGASRCLFC